MKIVCTEAEYIALLDKFKTVVTVIEKGDERIYRGENTLYGIPIEVEDGNTVRVVRCKDCARGKEVVCMENARYCTRYREVFDGADFCSYGERRINDGEI